MNKIRFQNPYIPPAIIQGICALLAAIIIVGGPILYLYASNFMRPDLRTEQLDSTKNKNNSSRPIQVIHNISSEDANETRIKLRSINKLRKLRPLESGRTILRTPPGTYFFVSSKQIVITTGNFKDCLNIITVKAFRQRESDFEIYYDDSGEILILAYVSDETGALLSEAGRDNESKIVLYPSYWNGFRNLALIPLNRIVKSVEREITIAERESRYVLDMVVR